MGDLFASIAAESHLIWEYDMPPTMDLQQIARFVSDGTGLTPEEVRLLGAVTAYVAVASGVLHTFQAVRRLIYGLGGG